jgi:hypothetical protein
MISIARIFGAPVIEPQGNKRAEDGRMAWCRGYQLADNMADHLVNGGIAFDGDIAVGP